jgi:hypothetical protein
LAKLGYPIDSDIFTKAEGCSAGSEITDSDLTSVQNLRVFNSQVGDEIGALRRRPRDIAEKGEMTCISINPLIFYIPELIVLTNAIIY